MNKNTASNEKIIFEQFLRDYYYNLSNACCNDFLMENNKENRKLLKNIYLWNVRGNIDLYKKDYEKEIIEYKNNESNIKEIFATDFMVFDYLCSKLGFCIK